MVESEPINEIDCYSTVNKFYYNSLFELIGKCDGEFKNACESLLTLNKYFGESETTKSDEILTKFDKFLQNLIENRCKLENLSKLQEKEKEKKSKKDEPIKAIHSTSEEKTKVTNKDINITEKVEEKKNKLVPPNDSVFNNFKTLTKGNSKEIMSELKKRRTLTLKKKKVNRNTMTNAELMNILLQANIVDNNTQL